MNSNYKVIIKLTEEQIASGHKPKQITYSQFVANLAKKMPTQIEDILHASIGMTGESAELQDAVKKVWVYGKDLDRENVIEELGDIAFYYQHMLNVLNITDEEVMEHNIAKLSKRYSSGKYSNEQAQARADKELPVFNIDLKGLSAEQIATVLATAKEQMNNYKGE